uniref:F-box domain-containing protein n=1 Tax=Trichuris muris TaxID=70415 RepID=A0A5S6R0H2_TRIMR
MEGASYDYSCLPLVPLVSVFKYLDLNSRCSTMAVCRKWRSVMLSESIWRETIYDVPGKWKDPAKALERIAEDFGRWHRKVTIRMKGGDPKVVFVTMNLICALSELLPRRIQSLTIQCVLHGGFFRHADEFKLCLRNFFDKSPISYGNQLTGLHYVDLSSVIVSLHDPLFAALFNNHGQWLTHVNLQNKLAHCRITVTAMKAAVKVMKQVEDLRICMASIDNDGLQAMIANNQGSLRHLSLLCRYVDGFRQNRPTDDAWRAFNNRWPQAAVTLIFTRNYPIDKFRAVMLPSVPLKTVCFEQPVDTSTIGLITDMYKAKLYKVVLRSKPADYINNQLVSLVLDSPHLRVLYIMHNLEFATATLINERKPKIKHNINFQDENVRFEPVPEEESLRPFVPKQVTSKIMKFPYSNLWKHRED